MRNKHLPFKYGDICFLPEQISQKEVNLSASKFLRKNRELIEKELRPIISVFDFLYELQYKYRLNSQNFPLFKKLPKKIQNYIATSDAIIHEDPYSIIPAMRYTSFGFIVLDDGIIKETIRAFELERLFGIRQLGFLMNPILRDSELSSNALGFTQTRGFHSLCVASLLRLIEFNNEGTYLISELLSIGGTSHDALTPAGSDTTKLINLFLFDEDEHYGNIFKKPGWIFLKNKYGIKESDLLEMIRNNGIYGQLLDIADKIAYTSVDVWEFVGLFEKLDEELKSERYKQLENIVNENPKFCDIWENVKILDDKMVIEDGYKLGIFLTIRALMFAELYYNPASRFLEYMLSKRIINSLFNNGSIDYEKLLEWKDYELEEVIWKFLGSRYFPTSFKESIYKKFTNEKERQNYIEKFNNDSSIVLIPDDFKCVTKTGVNKYSVKKEGKIMIFKDAYPEMASEIENIMTFDESFGLYVINLSDLNIPKKKYKGIKEKLENI